MKFTELELTGAYVIDIEPHSDERGFFARTWSREELSDRGLNAAMSQCSISFNERSGTLRGLHYQAAPHAEVKVVQCTAGAIFDVIVDLRSQSPTFLQWTSIELTADNRRSLYVPAGFAHGFQTLCDASQVFYQISTPYVAEASRGVRWDDPAIKVEWPKANDLTISARDRGYPDFRF